MSAAESPVQSNLHDNPKGGLSRAVSICSPSLVEKEQPKPLCALLPPSMEACSVYEVDQAFTSMRSQESLKTTSVPTEPDEEGKDPELLHLVAS